MDEKEIMKLMIIKEMTEDEEFNHLNGHMLSLIADEIVKAYEQGKEDAKKEQELNG